jgi:hypothetical protein
MQAAVQLKQKPDTNDHIPQQTQLKHIPLEMKKKKQKQTSSATHTPLSNWVQESKRTKPTQISSLGLVVITASSDKIHTTGR